MLLIQPYDNTAHGGDKRTGLPVAMGRVDNQVRSLRKRLLLNSYQNKTRTGTYCGVRSDVKDCPLRPARGGLR